MKLINASGEIYIPDNILIREALSRTTHMCIAAHQDDIEIMAFQGILECFGEKDAWFCGAVLTDGAGSARDDLYKNYSDEEMKQVRRKEQKKAAFIGEYGSMILFDYKSSRVKDPVNRDVIEDIKNLVSSAQPEIIYTHNPADKHDTHVSVVIKVINALRELPPDMRPKKLYGCEVWRNLDWLPDSSKTAFDVSSHPNLAASLLGVFDSQICGGKRYDLATQGRRTANATYSESHSTDRFSALNYAMNLTPLIQQDNLDIAEFVCEYIDSFKKDVASKIAFNSPRML